ncbi:primosomal protein N' [Thermodesulfobacteriota bacterium]
MTKNENICLRVAVTTPVRETFFYRISAEHLREAKVGFRVLVPFRNRRVTGYIIAKEEGQQTQDLKPVLEVMDSEALFHENLVPFFQWMADYYAYPIGYLIQSALPGGLNASPYKTGNLTEAGRKILGSLPSYSAEKKLLSWVASNPGKRLPTPLDQAFDLQKKGWLMIESRVSKRRTGPLIRRFIRVMEGIDLQRILEDEAATSRAHHEVEFLKTILEHKDIALKELTSTFRNGTYLVKKWTRRGVLEGFNAPVFRNSAGEIMFPAPVHSELFLQQENAMHNIRENLSRKSFATCMLYGVTGSGKTEVYFRAVEQAIRLGRQTILMVPEIALAIYMFSLFKSRMGNRIAIFHSGLSTGERYDQWIKMARGDVDLVIGARSALFAPLPKPGLIIVDEEHDFSYKQEEGPRYQARDAAVVRARLEKALVILGSGTPSVQTYHNAVTGRYQLLSMPERIEKRPLPAVEIVDMKKASDSREGPGAISTELREAIALNLRAEKQTLLFLNRRGFDRVFLCRACGQAIKCPNCDVPLIYHLKKNRLACHYCGYHSELIRSCPSCSHQEMRAYGFGTEKLEQELSALFPGSSIARMDRDSTRRKGEALKLLKKFGEHKIDILVGTQMITKGYDFPNVTLVGVIAADFSLGFPDFRAGERTFQILSQVAGRAGRGEHSGRVIVQTFNPDHYAIDTAKAHDYQSFYQKETELRQQLGYPPFSHLACLRFQGNNNQNTSHAAERLGEGCQKILGRWPKRGKEIQVLGPAEAPLAKLKGKYRWQILIKSKSAQLLHYYLEQVEGYSRKILRGSGVSMIVDIDPYQML